VKEEKKSINFIHAARTVIECIHLGRYEDKDEMTPNGIKVKFCISFRFFLNK
jgi:hypothetical protein